MEMKEMEDAALAYYKNLSDALKQKAHEKFEEMDSNGNGTISIKEFQRSMGISSEIKRCFKLMDKDGDGKLNFDEFITLYYLVVSERGVFCCGNGCKASPLFNGLYFTCVQCFDNNEAATFDLCTSCYRDRKYVHDHDNFLDNYILLRSKAACESTKTIGDEPNPAKSNQLIGQGLEMASDFLSQSECETETNELHHIIEIPKQDEKSLTAKSFSKTSSTEWTFSCIALCLEIMSLCFDQLSSPSKPTYALFGVLSAIAALLNCICELIHKGIKERVVLRRSGMLWWFHYPGSRCVLFGTLFDLYGLVGGIFQCICSTIQYVYFIRQATNPIKVSLLPTIFVICHIVSRINWNQRDKTNEEKN